MVFDTTVLVGTPISSGDVFLVDEERHLVKPRICGNCKHGKRKELGVTKEIWFDCYNQNVEEYWADSEGQLPRFPDGFGCIYWEARESEGK